MLQCCSAHQLGVCLTALCVLLGQNDDECRVLVMDETGAVGLDLSFVSWVFLMEPLQDRSLEAQVVARAHRMGARSVVHVEVLVMQVWLDQTMCVALCPDEHPFGAHGSMHMLAHQIDIAREW